MVCFFVDIAAELLDLQVQIVVVVLAFEVSDVGAHPGLDFGLDLCNILFAGGSLVIALLSVPYLGSFDQRQLVAIFVSDRSLAPQHLLQIFDSQHEIPESVVILELVVAGVGSFVQSADFPVFV